MLVDKLCIDSSINYIGEDKELLYISWLACGCGYVSILNIVRTNMYFPSPIAKAAFVIFFSPFWKYQFRKVNN